MHELVDSCVDIIPVQSFWFYCSQSCWQSLSLRKGQRQGNEKYPTLGLQIFGASPSVSTFALNAQASKHSPRPATLRMTIAPSRVASSFRQRHYGHALRFDGRALPPKDKTSAGALKSLGRFFTFRLPLFFYLGISRLLLAIDQIVRKIVR